MGFDSVSKHTPRATEVRDRVPSPKEIFEGALVKPFLGDKVKPCGVCGFEPVDGCSSPEAEDGTTVGVISRDGEYFGCESYLVHCQQMQYLRSWPIPPKYAEAMICDVGTKQRERVPMLSKYHGELLAWAMSIGGGASTNVVLAGPVGVGKSHALAAALLACKRQRKTVAFADVADLLARIRSTYDSGGGISDEDEVGILDDLRRVDVLGLDDIGKERLTDWGGEKLWQIAASRYNAGKPTIVTTNLGEKDLAGDDRLAALVDRWLDNGRLIKFEGESLRIPQ